VYLSKEVLNVVTERARRKTQMLIRKPVAKVFEAFVNPDITTKVWFAKSSGRTGARRARCGALDSPEDVLDGQRTQDHILT